MTLCTATINLGGSIAAAAYLLFVYESLHLSPALVGLIGGLGSAGFLVGTFAARPLANRFGVTASLLGATILGGVGLVATPFASGAAAVSVLTLLGFLRALQVPIYNINQVSLRQAAVPLELQGRMNATVRTIVWGTMPLGSLLGGVVTSFAAPRITIAVGGLIALAAAGWLVGETGIEDLVQRLRALPARRKAEPG